MRVLHLIDSGGFYGAERVLLELVGEQIKAGFSVMVGSLGAPTDSEKEIEVRLKQHAFPYESWRMPSGLSLRSISDFKKFVGSDHYDVIHTHGYRPNVLTALWRARPKSTKWIVTLHGWTMPRFLSKSWIYHFLDRLALNFADHIVCVGAHQVSMMRGRVRRKTTVIENGISVDNTCDEKFPHIGEAEISLLFVGRLSFEKGPDLAIRAISEVRNIYPELKLYIAGTGAEKQSCVELCKKLGLEEVVVFLGYKENVLDLMKRSDFLLISSRSEGLPIVLLEAMALRLPIVSTSVGSIPEALEFGELGELAEQEDAENLSQAITRAISSGVEVSSKADKANQKFCSHFSSSAMSEKYKQTYKELFSK